MPFDNLGIAVLTNDGMFGGVICEVVKWRLFDDALGLERVDWDARYKWHSLTPLSYKTDVRNVYNQNISNTIAAGSPTTSQSISAIRKIFFDCWNIQQPWLWKLRTLSRVAEQHYGFGHM
jgi:hypothetical protein